MSHALEALLDETRVAVLAGNLAALADLGPRIESLVQDLPPLRDRDVATRLRQKAERNAGLLTAASRGLRAAQTRLGEIAAGPTLTTYDARGQKAALLAVSTLMPRRA
jgi:hypothetical protein